LLGLGQGGLGLPDRDDYLKDDAKSKMGLTSLLKMLWGHDYVPEKDAELCEFNRELAARQRRPGQVVFEVRINELDPVPRSRIQSLSAVTIGA